MKILTFGAVARREKVTQLNNQLMIDKGVCRRAPATPGLLNISRHYMVVMLLIIYTLVFKRCDEKCS